MGAKHERRNTIRGGVQTDAANAYEKVAKPLNERIKRYHQLNPDVELIDSEHGLIAMFVNRKLPGHKYDFVAIRDGNAGLLARLVAVGALRVDHDAAEAADLGGEVRRYEVPSGESVALIVVRKT